MKKLLTTVFLYLSLFSIVPAQHQEPCGFDRMFSANRDYPDTEIRIQEGEERLRSLSSLADSIKAIPVVVHVIYLSGTENISDEQIESQIRILNEDYGKFPGTNGDGAGADTGVRFFLANLDPDGNCTNGIVRIKTDLTDHQPYERPLLRELSFWDNTRYLNIYVVKNIIGGIAGYSSFPGGPADEDGIVVEHDQFGDRGTSSELGRTMTHEIGHWLGLFHTFQDGCGDDVCTSGDLVCDTPPAKNPHYVCAGTNTCHNDDPDLDDLEENYMDYTPDECKNLFTEGQKMRMQATLSTLRTNIWSEENLLSTGYDSVFTPPTICPIHADFVTLTPDICIGNQVSFIDRSLNGATAWRWYLPGAVPAQSFTPSPTVFYGEVGAYDVTLVVTNDNGTDSITIENYINVSLPGQGSDLTYLEDFDSGLYPPQGTSIYNPDGGITWELDSVASASGKYSISLDNLNSTNYGTIDELILPDLDLSSLDPDSSIYLSFSWAYAKSVQSFTDELLVLLSTDCGQNFTQILYKNHDDLTTGPTQTTRFIPTADQWESVSINLDNYRSKDFVQIKFVNVTDGGNFLYLDDFYLGDGSDLMSATTNLSANIPRFDIFPNPAREQLNLHFETLEKEALQIQLLDVLGQKQMEMPLREYYPGNHNLQLPVADVVAGVYWLMLSGEHTQVAQKVIVK